MRPFGPGSRGQSPLSGKARLAGSGVSGADSLPAGPSGFTPAHLWPTIGPYSGPIAGSARGSPARVTTVRSSLLVGSKLPPRWLGWTFPPKGSPLRPFGTGPFGPIPASERSIHGSLLGGWNFLPGHEATGLQARRASVRKSHVLPSAASSPGWLARQQSCLPAWRIGGLGCGPICWTGWLARGLFGLSLPVQQIGGAAGPHSSRRYAPRLVRTLARLAKAHRPLAGWSSAGSCGRLPILGCPDWASEMPKSAASQNWGRLRLLHCVQSAEPPNV